MLLTNIIPFTGLDESLHTILFLFGIGMGGSILAALVFPKVFSPLFLMLKRKLLFRFKDAYIEKTNNTISLRTYLKRVLYCILTSLGLISFFIPLIDLSLILDSVYFQRFAEYGISPGYSNAVQVTVLGIFIPISVGIWSIGWAIEDAGLMHFRLQDDRKGKELYEIEPIHLKFFSYLKGFAGISSLFYLFEVGLAYGSLLQTDPEVLIDLLSTTLLPIAMILLLLPAYLLYAWKGTITSSLRKNLNQLKKLVTRDIYLED